MGIQNPESAPKQIINGVFYAMLLIATFLVTSTFLNPAHADSDGAIGVYYQMGELQSDNVEVEPDSLVFLFDGRVNQNLDIEFQYGFGISSDDIYGVDVEVEDFLSVFLKPNIDLDDAATVYMLLGGTRATLEASANTIYGKVSETATESDFSYGLGIDIHLAPGLSLTVQHINYITEDDGDFKGTNAGFKARF